MEIIPQLYEQLKEENYQNELLLLKEAFKNFYDETNDNTETNKLKLLFGFLITIILTIITLLLII